MQDCTVGTVVHVQHSTDVAVRYYSTVHVQYLGTLDPVLVPVLEMTGVSTWHVISSTFQVQNCVVLYDFPILSERNDSHYCTYLQLAAGLTRFASCMFPMHSMQPASRGIVQLYAGDDELALRVVDVQAPSGRDALRAVALSASG